jgi:hypothetical protein
MPRVERPSAPPGTRAKGECYPPKKEFSSLAISFVAQRLAAQKMYAFSAPTPRSSRRVVMGKNSALHTHMLFAVTQNAAPIAPRARRGNQFISHCGHLLESHEARCVYDDSFISALLYRNTV